MKIIVRVLLLFLLTQVALSNEIRISPPTLDTIDEFLDEDINFQPLDSLSNRLDTRDQRYKKYRPKEFVRKTPITPVIIYAVLAKGSHLHALEGESIIKNKEKIFVNASEVYYGGKWSYVYNKSGKKKYKTRTENLSFIEEVLKIRPTVPGNKLYAKKNRYHTVDKVVPLEVHLTYRSEEVDFKTLNIISEDTLEIGKATSLSFKSYIKSLLPIDFGIALDYQTGLAESSSESVNWSALSIGPTFKYNFYENKYLSLNTQFAVKKSLSFLATSDRGNLSLSTLAWQLAVEAAYKTKIGNFSLGVESSFIRASVKGEFEDQESFENTKDSMFQNAITVGYQYVWML